MRWYSYGHFIRKSILHFQYVFEKVNDPFLKINYQETKRPHYFALYDEKTKLFWMVPCSSKVAKYRGIIQKRKSGTRLPMPFKS